jgi:hypothetical protein
VLLKHVSSNDYPAFVTAYLGCRKDASEADAQMAWTLLTSVHVGSQVTTAAFTLPDARPPTPPHAPAGGVVVGMDDGATGLDFDLSGGEHLSRVRSATAQLRIMVPASGSSPGVDYWVPARGVGVDEAHGIVRATFPSLALVSGAAGPLLPLALRHTSHLHFLFDGHSVWYPASVVLAPRVAPPPRPGVSLASLLGLKATDGRTTLNLRIDAESPSSVARRVRLEISFWTNDAKPTSGRVYQVAAGGKSSPVLYNRAEVEIPAGAANLDTEWWIDQVPDAGATLVVVAWLEGAPLGIERRVAIVK